MSRKSIYFKMPIIKLFRNIFLCHLMLLISCTTERIEKSGDSGSNFKKTPVFFVHDHGVRSSSWNMLIKYLQKFGYPARFLRAIQLTPTDGPNIDAAEKQIAPAIEKFLAEINIFLISEYPELQPKTKVDIVSHSMGALSSRWYAAKVRPDRVRKWISLAGANHGTNVLCPTAAKRPGQGADDLCPAFAENEQQSYIQSVLNGSPYIADIDETPYGVGTDPAGATSIPPDGMRKIFYFSIRTINDKWIKPEESALIDGAGGINVSIPADLPAIENPSGNFQMKNGVRHDPMQYDPATMRLVKIILEMEYPD
jgi:pimeloyl-ACP methyl ester carboxylesterase